MTADRGIAASTYMLLNFNSDSTLRASLMLRPPQVVRALYSEGPLSFQCEHGSRSPLGEDTMNGGISVVSEDSRILRRPTLSISLGIEFETGFLCIVLKEFAAPAHRAVGIHFILFRFGVRNKSSAEFVF